MTETILFTCAALALLWWLHEEIIDFFKTIFIIIKSSPALFLYAYLFVAFFDNNKPTHWSLGACETWTFTFFVLAWLERWWRKFELVKTGGNLLQAGMIINNPYLMSNVGPRAGLSYLCAGCICFTVGALARMA